MLYHQLAGVRVTILGARFVRGRFETRYTTVGR